MTLPLAARLRDATRKLHTEVEHAGLMQGLLRGQATRAGYCRLLRALHPIYVALEAGLARHADHPGLSPLGLSPLSRSDLSRASALAADLVQLQGPDWSLDIPPEAEALAYAGHLQRLAEAQPALLAAHAYVRYLGDLSGGQILARRVAQGLGLGAGEAVAFYDFGGAARAGQLAAALRDGLDRIAPDEASAQALVDEAVAAFERHRALFTALARSV
jgi:heme oxygenase (biliverdin-producing, ferredoxin)